MFFDRDLIGWLKSKINSSLRVKEEEIFSFIGIILLTGYVNVPRRRMLWERSPDTHSSLVSNAMQRDRFEAIFSKLFGLNESDEFLRRINERLMHFASKDDQHHSGECSLNRKTLKNAKVYCCSTRDGYGTFVSLRKEFLEEYFGLLRGNVTLTLEGFDCDCTAKLQALGVQIFKITNRNVLERLETNLNQYYTSVCVKNNFGLAFTFAAELSLQNAWLLHKEYTENKKSDILSFRRKVVLYLLQCYVKSKLETKVNFHNEARYDGYHHFVVKQTKQTRCAHCKTKTTTRCSKCDVGVHVKCFVGFHTK